MIVTKDGTKREVKGEVKKGSAGLTNGSNKKNNNAIDSDGDISTGPLEEEMNLDDLMRQKVKLNKVFISLFFLHDHSTFKNIIRTHFCL